MAKLWPKYSHGVVKTTEKLPEHNSTLNAFLSPNGSEFGLTYLNEDCYPISLVYLKI